MVLLSPSPMLVWVVMRSPSLSLWVVVSLSPCGLCWFLPPFFIEVVLLSFSFFCGLNVDTEPSYSFVAELDDLHHCSLRSEKNQRT